MLISSLSESLMPGRNGREMDIGVFAGRVQQVAESFDSAATSIDQDQILSKARASGIQVERVQPQRFVESPITIDAVPRDVGRLLDKDLFHRLTHILRASASRTVNVAVVSGQLVFAVPPSLDGYDMLSTVVTGLGLILIPAAVLGFICAWMIGRPLVRFAAAAERVSMDDGLEEPFVAEGAIEIRSLAASLNTMRRRVLDLAGQRTRMLTSISHDLRTPLTR
ncbi:MAG: HAMP domain-containing protein, partial [Rhizobiaceae bacterium]|nr:HAMP domain-containing protein [Rhizobiaceae bacterium]